MWPGLKPECGPLLLLLGNQMWLQLTFFIIDLSDIYCPDLIVVNKMC